MRLSRIYYLLLVVIGSLALASCDDDDKVVDEGLKVLSAETSFDANGGEHEISVNKDVEGNYALDLPQLGLSVPVAFDESTFKLSIYAGHNLGVFQKYNTVSILGDSEAGYLVWNSAVSFTAGFQYSDEEGTYAEFEDNGSWPGYNVDYLAIGAYDGDELTNDSYLGNFLTMLNPYLLKIDASGARKKMNVATPKLSIMK